MYSPRRLYLNCYALALPPSTPIARKLAARLQVVAIRGEIMFWDGTKSSKNGSTLKIIIDHMKL